MEAIYIYIYIHGFWQSDHVKTNKYKKARTTTYLWDVK